MSSASLAAIEQQPAAIHWQAFRPARMVLSLIASDSLALGLAVAVSVSCKALLHETLDIKPYFLLLPFLSVFWAAFAAVGLYSGLALTPPEELRRCTLCSAIVFLFLGIATLSLRGAHTLVQPTLFLAIALSAAAIPLLRMVTRSVFGRRCWWGYPAFIFGSPEIGRRIADVMRRTPGLGLKPIAIVCQSTQEEGMVAGLPTYSFAELPGLEIPIGAYAVVTPERHHDIATELGRLVTHFSHILAIPELYTGSSNLLITPKAVGNLLGLEIRQRALLVRNRLTKRCLDISLTLLAAVFVLPLAVIIAILIKLDSDGPIFYFQRRIKRGGEFRAYKFRTMHVDADELLATCLQENEDLRAEWARDHKLRNDPRVTRLGRFLRKTSLDELPQLWNVLRCDMSLVGPRPIVQAEVARYGDGFCFYTQVPGGITGLWQVSGRNNTTYEERVTLDEYYVRNWSVWLDLYILFQTIGAVLLRQGAY